ncbi:MAG TPA: hypothetical protein VHW93_08195 [Acidimicrobiales bacterium]|jgi:hypothetical protein|nr:hypothetical protein [Acidimicrobiales bacterium]
MAADHDDGSAEIGLNERLLDLLVFVPAGLAMSVAEEVPKLAARGRERLGVQVSSARAVGEFAVKAGSDIVRRRSEGWLHRPGPDRSRARPAGPTSGGGRDGTVPTGDRVAGAGVATVRGISPLDTHIPPVTALSIPGFDALSASQVVQRLDGLNRSELVSVRTYESSTRGRRTILSRVDQLLDERS